MKTINSAFVFIAAISKTGLFFVIYLAVLKITSLSALFSIHYSAAYTKGTVTRKFGDIMYEMYGVQTRQKIWRQTMVTDVDGYFETKWN